MYQEAENKLVYCKTYLLYAYIIQTIFFFIIYEQDYGYSVEQLWDLLQEIRVHYNEVLMQHWVQVFRDILDEDSFLPIKVITSFILMKHLTYSKLFIYSFIITF